ncbi:MAG: DUF2278 family protein [Rhodospirillales bacterium]
MPLKSYGVLKGRPIDRRLGTHANAHYQLHLVDDDADYRIAVNVRSKLAPSELEYLIDDPFRHPVTDGLPALPAGFHPLPRRPGGLALDFIRGNLFDRTRMRPLPFDVPGPDNDLNEALDAVVRPALAEEDAMIYAFGERWGPEPATRDKIFGFRPGNGIHDIHMNQGNVGSFVAQDGVWQDGAMFVHLPSADRWVAVFLKFQSQTWHTDDVDGHRIETPPTPTPAPPPVERDGLVRIVAALVNPEGPAPERETVTLLNTSPQPIGLAGWAIADRNKQKHGLSGTLAAGATLVVDLPEHVQLGNKGGIITLLDDRGLKIDGVAYTRDQASREGWTIVF